MSIIGARVYISQLILGAATLSRKLGKVVMKSRRWVGRYLGNEVWLGCVYYKVYEMPVVCCLFVNVRLATGQDFHPSRNKFRHSMYFLIIWRFLI